MKRLITGIFLTVATFTLGAYVGIRHRDNVETPSISEYCDLVKIESGVSETIYYDKNTKVMYCLINEYSSITPIYNADGMLKLYEEN